MLTIRCKVYTDVVNHYDGQFLASEIEKMIRQHCDQQNETFVTLMEVVTLMPPSQSIQQGADQHETSGDGVTPEGTPIRTEER